MKILLGCDGFGEPLKKAVKEHLQQIESGPYEIVDYGCAAYYSIAAKIANEINQKNLSTFDDIESKTIGILFCGTGMGVSIVANKFKGVSAATCENVQAAICARAINDANILCLGGKVISAKEACTIVDSFLQQGFISAPCYQQARPSSGAGNREKNLEKQDESTFSVAAPEWWGLEVEGFLRTSKKGIEETLKEYSF